MRRLNRLIRRVQQTFDVTSSALDYSNEFMELNHIEVDVVDLNQGALPYPDTHFDLVTFTEVAEHLENYRAIVREIYRILKPGGVVIITTPNVLNMKSRMRFLTTGFGVCSAPCMSARQLLKVQEATLHRSPTPIWPMR